jgi:predicted nucleic acid-binding protein
MPVIVGDSDGLIALIFEGDVFHQKAVTIANNLYESGATIIFPLTTLVETTTTIQRKLGDRELTAKAVEMITNAPFIIEVVDKKLLTEALTFFNPMGSKQHTLFDACVAAVAKKHFADAIFSFDDWYKKRGFVLINDLLQ